jgi:hypothetical protein
MFFGGGQVEETRLRAWLDRAYDHYIRQSEGRLPVVNWDEGVVAEQSRTSAAGSSTVLGQ